MSINWYPGHMHKARKELKKLLPQIDVIVEVLDARIPYSSRNPLLNALGVDRPRIKILNKCDLADPGITQLWRQHLEQQQATHTLTLDENKAAQTTNLIRLCQNLVPEKADKARSVNALIIGIPNVGKSTLINALAGRTIAKTGNEPAVTKAQQRINLGNGVVLFDSPGMLWPKIESPDSGYRLAISGAIRETALDYGDVAIYAAAFLLRDYPEQLQQRYELEQLPDGEIELLDAIARRRGCLRGGGHTDFDKVSTLLIQDIRRKALGPLSFETPAMVNAELAELESRRRETNEAKPTQ